MVNEKESFQNRMSKEEQLRAIDEVAQILDEIRTGISQDKYELYEINHVRSDNKASMMHLPESLRETMPVDVSFALGGRYIIKKWRS